MSAQHRPDDANVRTVRERLYSAVLSDALDGMGLLRQRMGIQVRALHPMMVMCGRARTVEFQDTYHAEDYEDAYGMLVPFEDSLGPGDVAVFACGQSPRLHPFGGMQAQALAMRGVAGCVTDGLVRDVNQIRELGLPTFASGYGAIMLPGRGRLVAVDVPVHCSGVWVSPGDLVFGDEDSVVVLPRHDEDAVIAEALRRADVETRMISELREGVPLREVYRRYGTL